MNSQPRVNFKALAASTLPPAATDSTDLRALVTAIVQQELSKAPAPSADLRPRLDALESQLKLLALSGAETQKETTRAALVTAMRASEEMHAALQLVEDLADDQELENLHAHVDRKFTEISGHLREASAAGVRSQEEISRLQSYADTREAEMRASVEKLAAEWESRLSRIEAAVSESLTSMRSKQESAVDKLNENIKNTSAALYRLQTETGNKLEYVRSEIKASEAKISESVNFKLQEVRQSENRVKQSLQDAVKLLQNNSQQSEFELRSILKASEQFMSDNIKTESRKQSDNQVKLEQQFVHTMQQLEIKLANAMHGNFEETDKRVASLKQEVARNFKEFADNLDDTKIQLITDLKDMKMKVTELALEQVVLKEHGERRVREVSAVLDGKASELSEKISKAVAKAAQDAINAQDLAISIARKEISDHHSLALKYCEENAGKMRQEISDQLRGAVETLAERIALVDVDLRDNKDRLDERIDKCSDQGRRLSQELSALENVGKDIQDRLNSQPPALQDAAFVTQLE